MLTIGIIREGKVPPDSRVAMVPGQCAKAQELFPLRVRVQPSTGRCFPDTAYRKAGIELTDDLTDCDLLMGIKEVPIDQLIPDKTYCFFSHTIKKQAYNRKLLQAVLAKNIRLIDYEVLTSDKGRRLIAFGRFAGMVGAHNALWTYAQRTGTFELPRMKDLHDYEAAQQRYQKLRLPPMRIVLTGDGRVGKGAVDVLRDMRIRQLSPQDFLTEDYDEPVFTQLHTGDYVAPVEDKPFHKQEFFDHPERFRSIFEPYTRRADIFINGIYWDNAAPVFFTPEQAAGADWSIQVISDVTCDIAPVSSIPATLRATTIADPVFGWDPVTGQETAPFQAGSIDMMTIDNLPNEMPKDASRAFGRQFLDFVLPEFFKADSAMLRRATVAQDGALGPSFGYLRDYVAGR